MSRAIDRLSILGLILVILLLLLKFLEDKPAASQESDRFNMAGYEDRKAEFKQDIDRENRLERKSK